MATPKTFEELLEQKYGKPGEAARDQFDHEDVLFAMGEALQRRTEEGSRLLKRN